MHELSLALGILEGAAEEAARHGGGQVTAIHLRLGPLAGVVKEALLSAFDLARETSPWPSVQLAIEDVPLRGHCPCCQETRTLLSVQDLCCQECGTPTPDLVSGRELEIVALEIL